MDILLFLGSEFLKRMTNPTVSAEERESLHYELSAYLEREQGGAAIIVDAFNRLDFEEALSFDRETILWYLDWVTMEQRELTRRVEPASIAGLWSAFNEPVVRTRAVEVLIDVESLRDVRPSQSQIINLVQRALGRGDESVGEATDTLPAPDVQSVLSQIVNTLLTDQRPFGLRVLGQSLEHMPYRYRQRLEEEVEGRLATLGEARAGALREAIRTDRRRE
jgi:hypothetical protein